MNGKLWYGAEVGGPSVKQQQEPIKKKFRGALSQQEDISYMLGATRILRPQEAGLTSVLPFPVLPYESQPENSSYL